METVIVVYHYEDGLWWAEAEAFPEFTSGGESFAEARTLTLEGLELAAGRPIELDERFDPSARVARQTATSLRVSGIESTQVYLDSSSLTPAAARPAPATAATRRLRPRSVASSTA